MAVDQGPQADCGALSALNHRHVLCGWVLCHADPAGAADPGRGPGFLRHVQQAFQHAWHRDGLFLPHSVGAGGAGQFLYPLDGGGQRPGVSPGQPLELVPLHRRRHLCRGVDGAGGVDTGWTFYTPFSTHYSNTHVVGMALGVFIAGFSSILTGLNFIVTIHRMRAPGLTWARLPLFCWSHYATSIIMILGTPVIAITLLLVALERLLHIGIFNPAMGGDPVLFQHLFWFYSHPAVYIMILP